MDGKTVVLGIKLPKECINDIREGRVTALVFRIIPDEEPVQIPPSKKSQEELDRDFEDGAIADDEDPGEDVEEIDGCIPREDDDDGEEEDDDDDDDEGLGQAAHLRRMKKKQPPTTSFGAPSYPQGPLPGNGEKPWVEDCDSPPVVNLSHSGNDLYENGNRNEG